MQYLATKKVPGGKLLRVKIVSSQSVDTSENIETIHITGDFFLHPEESLPNIEKALLGLSIQTPENIIAEKIRATLLENGANFVGVSAEDIAQTIIDAIVSAKQS